ncbi:MAG: molecular chaperone DnaK, partial [Lachnospiraceae bacterium]|nr:molecular chaperone DnaK [Lachnospiraceae bacterium]
KHPEAENMSDSDVDEIKSAKEKLMESAQKLFAKVYENAQAAGAGNTAGPDYTNASSSGSDDNNDGGAGPDVVDGDYREV